MGKKNDAVAIHQKVTSGLIIVVFAVALNFFALAQEPDVKPQRRQRKDVPQGQALQRKGLVRDTLGIGEHDEGPAVILLIGSQSFRIGKGDDDDSDTTPLELIL